MRWTDLVKVLFTFLGSIFYKAKAMLQTLIEGKYFDQGKGKKKEGERRPTKDYKKASE